MSREEVVTEIERLRAKMHDMANADVDYIQLLKISQELDEFIVLYHKMIA